MFLRIINFIKHRDKQIKLDPIFKSIIPNEKIFFSDKLILKYINDKITSICEVCFLTNDYLFLTNEIIFTGSSLYYFIQDEYIVFLSLNDNYIKCCMMKYINENNYDFFRYKFIEKEIQEKIEEIKLESYYDLFPKIVIIFENSKLDIIVS